MDMAMKSETPGLWEFSGQISARLSDNFHFVRDHDRTQIIYPLEAKTTSTSVPIMGPDEGGMNKKWHIWGYEGEFVTVRLQIKDGDITVTSNVGSMGELTWRSAVGGPKDMYYVIGTWDDWKLKDAMKSSPTAYDAHNYQFTIGQSGIEQFQIVVNQNFDFKMYPAVANSPPGNTTVRGPDAVGDGFAWEVVGPPGEIMEITLDIGAEDRRNVVTCRPLGGEGGALENTYH